MNATGRNCGKKDEMTESGNTRKEAAICEAVIRQSGALR